MSPRQKARPPSARGCTRRRGLSGLASVLIAACAAAPRAGALDLDSEDSRYLDTLAYRQALKTYDNIKKYGAERVVDRSRQEYSPDGIRIGNYIILPEIGSRVVFDDNVFATAHNRIADFRHELSTGVALQSHLPRHVLDVAVGGKLVTYFNNPELDYADGFASVNAGLHFDHAHTLSLSVLSSLDHEDRLDAFAPANARELTPVWYNRLGVGLKRDAGRLYGSVGFTAQSWDYFDVKARDGSTIDQDRRDVAVYAAHLKAGYRFSPGYELQAKMRLLRQDSLAGYPFSQDAWGYEAIAGLAAELNPLLRWRLLGGYAIRDFDRSDKSSAGTGLLEAEVQWLPTQLMTVSGIARRTIGDGIAIDGSVTTIDTSLIGKVDYEVLRNLVFTLQAEYRDSEYIGEMRRDQFYVGRIGIDYHYTKNWLFSLGYEYQQRQSNLDENDLRRNRIWLGARLRF
jgi:hypothetical protein